MSIVAFLATVLFAAPATAPEPAVADPVADLRAALEQEPVSNGVEAREKSLMKCLDALHSPGELAAALDLKAWPTGFQLNQFQPNMKPDVAISIRLLVIKKFEEQIRKALSADDPETRAAAATLLGATATTERALQRLAQANTFRMPGGGLGSAPPFADLAPDLLKRMKEDKEASVRREAIRSLVVVQPDPQQAVDAVGALLGPREKDASVRRAAAAALGAALAEADEEQAASMGFSPAPTIRLLKLAQQAIPLAASCLAKDDDVAVRRHCLTALRRVTLAWQRLVEFGYGRTPGARSVPDNDATLLAAQLQQSKENQKLLESLSNAMNKALPSVTEALAEDKPEIAVVATEILEIAADVRRLTLKDSHPDPLPALLDARDALTKNLSAKEVRVRLTAVYVLEVLGAEAAPAAAVLAKTLLDDADPFVRWGAARALGKMAPDQLDAVPALVKALEDKNDDVRQMRPRSRWLASVPPRNPPSQPWPPRSSATTACGWAR